MGFSKEMFINLRMREEEYQEIPPDYREQMEILKIDEKKPSYPDSELWTAQDKVCKKAYKKLKAIEFDLRNETLKKGL